AEGPVAVSRGLRLAEERIGARTFRDTRPSQKNESQLSRMLRTMTRRALAFAAVLLIPAFGSGCSRGSTGKGMLVVRDRSAELGAIEVSAVGHAGFRLQNVGMGPLMLTRIALDSSTTEFSLDPAATMI